MNTDMAHSAESGSAAEHATGSKPSSTRVKGNIDTVLILSLLDQIGYATGKQVAKAIWGEITDSTRRLANRKISQMLDRGQLLEKRDSITSDRLVALSQNGARTLDEFVTAWARSGKDLLRHAHPHRTRANDVFVAATRYKNYPEKSQIDWPALSESRIQRHPELAREFGARRSFVFEGKSTEKVADLLLNPNHPGERVWIEIENAYRSRTDLQKLTAWLIQTMRQPSENQPKEVWFVVTKPGAKTIKSRVREALLQEESARAGRVDGRPIQLKNAALQAWQKCRFYRLDHDVLELRPM